MDAEARTVQRCTDPACDSHETGHLEFIENDVMHTRAVEGAGWGLEVIRMDDVPTWSVNVDIRDDIPAWKALELAQRLIGAASEANALNAPSK